MYFVSYTTNKFELPQLGYNVWEVKQNKRSKGNPNSFNIIKIIIGGKKRDAKNLSTAAAEQYIVSNKRDVFERIFNL